MEDSGVPKQLIVFAREIGELYRLERSRNAKLDDRIEETEDGNTAPPGCGS
jgi:hypothetical protein